LRRSNLWTDICSKVVELLNQRNIQHSSIDLVCFSWVEEYEDIDEDVNDEDIQDIEGDVDDEDIDIKIAPYGTVVTTPVTIWVGVLPDTLTSEVAFHSSNNVLDLLKEHDIFDIDVAYRESVARGFSGPELFAPEEAVDETQGLGHWTCRLGTSR